MTTRIVRFVDPATNAERLNINDPNGFQVGRGLDTGSSPIEEVTLSQQPYDGEIVAASRRPRVAMEIPLIFHRQSSLSAIQTLWNALAVELDRATNRIEFRVTKNLFSANEADVETDATGFSSPYHCTIARSLAQAWHGAASLAMVSTFAGAGRAEVDMADVPTVAGRTYVASAYSRSATSTRKKSLVLLNVTGNPTSTETTDTNSGWTRHSIVFVATGSSAGVRPRVGALDGSETLTVGETHYWDGMQIEEASAVSAWELPVESYYFDTYRATIPALFRGQDAPAIESLLFDPVEIPLVIMRDPQASGAGSYI